ncbi:hypothetical protein GLAREA_00081 [Glarea lozoyensis ATCC 20868]|uniref:Fungal N-terminal domain-containing protein n=1 Tax=Glarea lozoyensis (strain ATCC 20868 / MF5171) TaxID=1116229 RepID=S3DR33_GLAL2|nr:uncharacterized protein GLAREA_00081 [Glarea lozoyensis ATCC 20868]EPE28923.1 hypothetical protein GLAREA_00081 [Glarea lozoyensis ATCC 20868]
MYLYISFEISSGLQTRSFPNSSPHGRSRVSRQYSRDCKRWGKVIQRPLDVAKAFGNAGKDVKVVANEISALCRVFNQIGNTLKNGSEATANGERLAGDLLEMCEDLLMESRELLEVLRPLVALSESHYKKAILRIQWLFQKSKFAAHSQSLGLLQGLYFERILKTRNHLFRDIVMHTSNLLEYSKTATFSFKSCQILSNYVESSIDGSQESGRHEAVQNFKGKNRLGEPGNEDIIIASSQASNSIRSSYGNTSRGSSSAAEQPRTYIVALRPPSTSEQDDLDDYVTRNDLQFTPSKTILDFHIEMDFIQRATVRFANYALNSETPEVSEGKLPSISYVSSSSHSYFPQSAPEIRIMTSRSLASNSRRTDNESPPRRGQEPFEPRIDRRPRQSTRRPSRTTKHNPEDVLYLTDSRGWDFTIPFSHCISYGSLLHELRDIYANSPQYFQFLNQKKLMPFKLRGTVYGMQDRYILPDSYETHVHPGDRVTVEFESEGLNGSPEEVELNLGRVVGNTQRGYREGQAKIESKFGAPGKWFNRFTNAVLVEDGDQRGWYR